jgi:hypothetical protein
MRDYFGILAFGVPGPFEPARHLAWREAFVAKGVKATSSSGVTDEDVARIEALADVELARRALKCEYDSPAPPDSRAAPA